jgi:hypothetical protein
MSIRDVSDKVIRGAGLVPPVDRAARVLTDGTPVTEDHRELRPNGQQKAYVVLSAEERARGFVRPLRRSYVHAGVGGKFYRGDLIQPGANGCGAVTTMSAAIAETYARDPAFYSGTFCVGCGVHRPLAEFVWDGTEEIVGS